MFSQLSSLVLKKDGKTITPEDKIEWLRSQIIGQFVQFVTPFGKRFLTYADHTASGRSLLFIENFILCNLLPVYGNTHTDDSFVGQITGRFLEEAENYVKNCMGGTDKEAILFCGSGSTAAIKRLQEVIGIAVPSTLRNKILAGLEERQRWVVFIGPYEHHSNILTWRQSLAEVVEVPLGKDGFVDMERLKAALEEPRYKDRPKLGSFSAASNVTGILTDTRSIAGLLHSYGAFACFDFAACAPYVKIDFRSGQAEGYDAVFVSPHKFLGGPGTSGILMMSRKLYFLKQRPPSTCGGGTVDFVNFDEENTIYYNDIEQRESAGTPSIIQTVRSAWAYSVKEFMSEELIASREAFLIETAMARLSKNANIHVYGNTTANRLAILSFGVYSTLAYEKANSASGDLHDSSSFGPKLLLPLQCWGKSPKAKTNVGKFQGKAFHGRFIVKLLNDLFGIQARGGCSCAAPFGHALLGIDDSLSKKLRGEILKGYRSVKPGWARISFGYYITSNEFDFILSAIEFIAEFGQRFLELYDLNWKTGDWTFKQPSEQLQLFLEKMEKRVIGENNHGLDTCFNWLQSPRPILDPNPTWNVARLTRDAYNTRLRNYLKLARILANCLPEQPRAKRPPGDLDSLLLTFRT